MRKVRNDINITHHSYKLGTHIYIPNKTTCFIRIHAYSRLQLEVFIGADRRMTVGTKEMGRTMKGRRETSAPAQSIRSLLVYT